MTTNDPTPASDVTHAGGMRAERAFPTAHQSHLDPFVLFERFFIGASQGFDTHPHRGFEIVSYVLDGGMEHDDSLGHSNTARAGDAMRITTGSGMRHSELPADDSACNGLQLWVNLPREQKEVDPSYQEASDEELPVESTDGATVKTVVGEGSPVELHSQMEYLDVEIADSWTWAVPDDWVGFCFAISGEGRVDDASIRSGEYFTANGEASPTVTTDAGLRLVAVSGVPHGEEIRQRGPFVE